MKRTTRHCNLNFVFSRKLKLHNSFQVAAKLINLSSFANKFSSLNKLFFLCCFISRRKSFSLLLYNLIEGNLFRSVIAVKFWFRRRTKTVETNGIKKILGKRQQKMSVWLCWFLSSSVNLIIWVNCSKRFFFSSHPFITLPTTVNSNDVENSCDDFFLSFFNHFYPTHTPKYAHSGNQTNVDDVEVD